jgi:DNA gyrase/topoisomerase IV subunit A
MNSSEYINSQRKEYSLYVLQSRSIPHAADGLKSAARRVLWIARNGQKHKCATLGGAAMPLHPHAAPESTINTLAAPYGNNIPLLTGLGAFGTLLNPTAYGASRYTSVYASQFTKDALYTDIEIIPMVENYDGTLMEPKHFLPLIPVAALNAQEGIAVGFATNILPRDLKTIIGHQIKHLSNQTFKDSGPCFTPTNQQSRLDEKTGKWNFVGSFKKINTSTLIVTGLPYGRSHEKYLNRLAKLEDDGIIIDIEDNSKDIYDIQLKFKRGTLSKKTDEEILKFIFLTTNVIENYNLIDFDGTSVWQSNYIDLIKDFTDWRLIWYIKRYQRLAKLLAIEIQKYKDILLAIRRNIGGIAKKTQSRKELKIYLSKINIVHIDYIADLPIYRFTEEEKQKIQSKLIEAEALMKHYTELLNSEDKRKAVYISELKNILHQYNKNKYVTI